MKAMVPSAVTVKSPVGLCDASLRMRRWISVKSISTFTLSLGFSNLKSVSVIRAVSGWSGRT